MNLLTIVALLCLAVVFISERLFDGVLLLSVTGVGGFIATIAAQFIRRKSATGGHRYGVTVLIAASVVIAIGVALYPLSMESVAASFGFVDSAATRFTGVFSALWPLVVTIGLIVLVVVDHALVSSPVMIPKSQVSRALSAALGVGFALGLVFAANFIADRHNTRWDLSYFKTAQAGSATVAMVNEAPSPLVVRIFQAPSSAVSIELRNYFDNLSGPKLRYEIVDLPAEPELSQKLKIRDNGYISVSTEAIEQADKDDKKEKGGGSKRAQTFKIGTDINDRETKQNLRKLDSLFGQSVLKLMRGRMNAYFVVGHGERGAKKGDALTRTKAFKEGIEQFNFRVRELGAADGLSNAVPESADVVVILGPDFGLAETEVNALIAYLNRGGSLLLAVEPKALRAKSSFGTEETDATDKLLAFLGVELDLGTIVGSKGIVPITKTKQDRLNLVTNKFGSHPSTKTLVGGETKYELFVAGAAALRETKKGEGKTTVTAQMPSETWLDVDNDLNYDAQEKRSSYPVAIASTGGSGDEAFRAIVVGDASAFADLAMLNPGNQRFALDGLNWLTRSEALSGETKSEEDVKFQPRKAEQSAWFYLTVLGVPFLLLAVGGFRIRRRYGKGES